MSLQLDKFQILIRAKIEFMGVVDKDRNENTRNEKNFFYNSELIHLRKNAQKIDKYQKNNLNTQSLCLKRDPNSFQYTASN